MKILSTCKNLCGFNNFYFSVFLFSGLDCFSIFFLKKPKRVTKVLQRVTPPNVLRSFFFKKTPAFISIYCFSQHIKRVTKVLTTCYNVLRLFSSRAWWKFSGFQQNSAVSSRACAPNRYKRSSCLAKPPKSMFEGGVTGLVRLKACETPKIDV